MGTWSCPNTKEKAQALEALMSKPLPSKMAQDSLYHLMGNDRLFDRMESLSDVRELVASELYDNLNELETYVKPWEPEAIAICKNIVSKFGY